MENMRKFFYRCARGRGSRNLFCLDIGGFLGGNVAKRAILEGYSVTCLSRRGKMPESSNPDDADDNMLNSNSIKYCVGDARDKSVLRNILLNDNENDEFVAVVHCIGLLFDTNSGFWKVNRFISGSGSIPDEALNYDEITRLMIANHLLVFHTTTFFVARERTLS